MKVNTGERIRNTPRLTKQREEPVVEKKISPKRQQRVAKKNSRANKHRSILDIVGE